MPILGPTTSGGSDSRARSSNGGLSSASPSWTRVIPSAWHSFPGPEHGYGVDPEELAEFRRYLDQESLVANSDWEWEPLS